MAAVSRLQSLTNKTSLQNLIHRHLLRPVAAASTHPFCISPESQPSVQFDLQNSKSFLTGLFSEKNKLSSHTNEFVLNWKFPIGVSALRTSDLSLMELSSNRSTSSKNRPDLEEGIEDDDEDYFNDDDDGLKDFDDIDDAYGSCSDSNSDDDDYGRRGGSRGGGAYTV